MAVFIVKSNVNTYPKGRALIQMYRVVPITIRGNQETLLVILAKIVPMNSVVLVIPYLQNWIKGWSFAKENYLYYYL